MSGIIGVWRRDGRPVEIARVNAALRELRSGAGESPGYLLGNTRSGTVSIRDGGGAAGPENFGGEGFDLVWASSQPEYTDRGCRGSLPAAADDRRLFTFYEGEIYNLGELREYSGSRRREETALAAAALSRGGIGALPRFNGLFALVFWDRAAGTLTAARDPVGGHPLYYLERDNAFIFSTRIKALLAGGWLTARGCRGAIRDFIVEDYPAVTETWFAGVRRLMSGTYISVGRSKADLGRYWRADYTPAPDRSAEETAKILGREITRAVRVRRGRSEDLAAHLSGGVDSSLTAAFLAEQAGGKNIATYSGWYTGYDGDPRFDETPDAARVARAAGCPNIRVEVDFRRLPELLPRIVRLLEEPHGLGAFSQYCVFAATGNDGKKVVFCGEGGDELFAGYDYHKTGADLDRLTSLSRLPELLRVGGRRRMEMIKTLLLRRYPFRTRRIRRRETRKNQPFTGDFLPAGEEELTPLLPHPVPRGFLSASLLHDFGVELPCLMELEQGLASAFGLRLRAPLTDQKIVRLAQSIPPALQVNGERTKYCLRLAGERLVPRETIWRARKMGFTSPFSLFLREPFLGDYCRELLLSPGAPDFLDREFVADLFSRHREGRIDAGFLIWKLIYLAEWIRVFRVSV